MHHDKKKLYYVNNCLEFKKYMYEILTGSKIVEKMTVQLNISSGLNEGKSVFNWRQLSMAD